MWYVNIAKQLDDLGPKRREEVLRQLLDTLAQITEHEKAFVEVLLQENVLTRPQMELIMKRESKYERNVAAYNKVIENGNGRVLIWALHLTQNHHVITEIQGKLEKNQRSSASSSSPGPSSPSPSTSNFKGLQNLLADSPISMTPGSPGSPYQNSLNNGSPAMVNMGGQSPQHPHSPASTVNMGHQSPSPLINMGHQSPSPLAMDVSLSSPPQTMNGQNFSIPPTSITNQMPTIPPNPMPYQNFPPYPYSHVVQHPLPLTMTSQSQNQFSITTTPSPNFQSGHYPTQNSQQGQPTLSGVGVNWAPPHAVQQQTQNGQGAAHPFALPPSPPFDAAFEDVTMTPGQGPPCRVCGRDFDICQILRDCPLSKDDSSSNNANDNSELYMF